MAFASAEELCRRPEVDAVLVATPNSCHLRDTLTALECGKPVLVEKPMAMNAAEARQMIEAAASKRVPLGVAQIFRFAESTRRLRERIAGGQIGQVAFARSEFCYWGPGAARTWINDITVAGGGPIADTGVHCIDALRYILDDDVASVMAQGAAGEQSGTVEATAVLALQFRRGTLATVTVSTRAQYRTPLEFVGELAVLRAEDALSVEKPVTIELRRGAVAETEQVTNERAYARQIDAFAATVERGVPFPVPAEEGWKNQIILDAAYRSMKTGTVASCGF